MQPKVFDDILDRFECIQQLESKATKCEWYHTIGQRQVVPLVLLVAPLSLECPHLHGVLPLQGSLLHI